MFREVSLPIPFNTSFGDFYNYFLDDTKSDGSPGENMCGCVERSPPNLPCTKMSENLL